MAISTNNGISDNKSQALSFANGEVSLMSSNKINLAGLTDPNPSKKMIDIEKFAGQTIAGRGRFADSIA